MKSISEQLQLSRKTQTIAPKLPEIGNKYKACKCIKIAKMRLLLVFSMPYCKSLFVDIIAKAPSDNVFVNKSKGAIKGLPMSRHKW